MKHSLTKKDLVLRICKATDISADKAKTALETVLNGIQLALSNGRHVELRSFGSFEVQVHKSRIGRNPQSPEAQIVIPDRAVIKFKPGQYLKAELKKIDVKSLK